MSTESKKHIDGGEFLIRDIQPEEVFTPEDFNEEQKLMAAATTEFVDKEVWPNKGRFETHDYDFTFELLKKAGEMGLLGISVPEAHGGLGMDFTTSMLVCDRISGSTGSLSTAFGAHTGIGTLPIVLYGTEEQQKKYLPKLASGEWIGAYCLTEPGAGSDANSGRTKAELSKDGKSWVINGQKMWISNAGYADLFIVFARIEDDKNITGFIVEKGTEGLTLGDEEQKMGIHSSSTRQVFFNNLTIPAENLLGERNGGFKIAMNALNVGRIKLAAATLDANRRVMDVSFKYANEREQFKQKISSFGAIQHKIAEMTARHFAIESATYRAGQDIENSIVRLKDSGMSDQESKLKGVEEFAVECAILKVHASEASTFIADEGIQIHGGMGYSADAPVESAYRDVRIARIYEGTNEINRMLIVGMLLKKALKGELDLMSPAMKIAGELMEIPNMDLPDFTEPLSEEALILSNLKKAILMVAGKAVETFGANVEEEQEILMSIADMIIETYVAQSAVLRAARLTRSNDDKAEMAREAARLYLHLAVERIQHAGKEAIYSFASGDEQRMMLMGLRRFTKWHNIPNTKDLRRSIAAKVIAGQRI